MPSRLILKDKRNLLQRPIQAGLSAAGEILNGQAKALCPVDKGGLRNSVQYRLADGEIVGKNDGSGEQIDKSVDIPTKGDSIKWGSPLFYAPYVDRGTRYQPAQPFISSAIEHAKSKRSRDAIARAMGRATSEELRGRKEHVRKT